MDGNYIDPTRFHGLQWRTDAQNCKTPAVIDGGVDATDSGCVITKVTPGAAPCDLTPAYENKTCFYPGSSKLVHERR